MPLKMSDADGHLSRRQAIARLAAAATAGLAVPEAAAQSPARGALSAYIDVLLPGDDALPPASVLGISDEMAEFAGDGSTFARLLAAGTGWLDRLDDRAFADLPRSVQADVVEWMANAPYDEIPGRFYHVVRLIACELYYAHPEARAGLPLNTAPQPAGYLPPWGEA